MKNMFFLILLIISTCSAQEKVDLELEKELIKVKNQAFCDCYFYSVGKKEKNTYKDGSSYVHTIILKDEYIFQNKNYYDLVHKWADKVYKSYNPEDNLYLMKCLDFYNSEDLKIFINYIRENELRLKEKK